MKWSQLKIDGYVFKKIQLESFDAEEPENWVVTSSVEVLRRKDDPHRWLVELTVQLKGDKPVSPYSGEFQVAGSFQIAENLGDEVGTNLVNVNGPSVLYSAVREMVLHLTSRGPHKAVLLPSVSFIDRKAAAKQTTAKTQASDQAKGTPEQVTAI